GNSVFDYYGPRGLLLVVISRWADVGRGTVEALWEGSEHVNLARIDKLAGFRGGLALMGRIEVYPGYVSPAKWTALMEVTVASQFNGTIDVNFARTRDEASIAVSCKGAKNGGAGSYSLVDEATQSGSGCVPLRMLPATGRSFRAVKPAELADLKAFL